MLLRLVTPLLALPLLVACEDAQVRASEAVDRASVAMSDLAEEMREFDVSRLSPDALVAKGRELSRAVADKLDDITDEESARRLVQKLEPVVDKLKLAQQKVGDAMPSMEELKQSARNLERRVAGDEGLEGIVRPLIEKIESLFE